MIDEWKRDSIERARRDYLRKTLDAAEGRMRTRTAKQQLAEAMRLNRSPDELPDADDSSVHKRYD